MVQISKLSKVKVGLIQTEISFDSLDKILEKVDLYINQCIENNVNLICLPELFAEQINIMDLYSVAETIPGDVCNFLCERAKKYNVFIIAGILEKDGYEIYNSAVLINSKGEIIGVHRKIYLNNFERGFLSYSNKVEVFDTELGRIGILIGNDIDSFIVCQKLIDKKVELVVCLMQIPDEISSYVECIAESRALSINAFIILVTSFGVNKLARMNFKGISRVLVNPLIMRQANFKGNRNDIILEKTDNAGRVITCQCDMDILNKKENNNYSLNQENITIE